MLKLRLVCRFALAAASLCATHSALSQGAVGLGAKLDAAEKKLDEDVKACRPIDVKDYQALSDEASRNLKILLEAAGSGAPVDTAQFKSDRNRATALLERAKAAAAKPCPPPKQQPQNAGPAPKKVEVPPPAPAPQAAGAQGNNVDPLGALIWESWGALEDLDDAMDDCDVEAVKKLIPKLSDLSKRAHEAAETAKAAGKFSKADPAGLEAMAAELDKAIFTAELFKQCKFHGRLSLPVPKQAPQSTPGKSDQPKSSGEKPKAGTEPNAPKPPEHSIIEDLFPKTPPPPQPNGKTSSALPFQLSPFASRILDIHNGERSAVGAAALRWNFQLEQDASSWARQLAEMHQLVHAPREGRGIERENLLQARIGWSPDRMMQSWTDEKRDFAPGHYPNVARDGNWLNVSHYTQMIWPTTTDIGCGMAQGGGFEWVVCRYSPGGNKDGKPVGMIGHQAFQWIDTKTGKAVFAPPYIPDAHGHYHVVLPDVGDPNRAYDSNTGRNFFRDQTDGRWKDTKTRQEVFSPPYLPDSNGHYHVVLPNAGDPNRAFDPETGRNLAKVPVETKQAYIPERG